MSDSIDVLLVEDHTMVRDGIVAVLEAASGIDVTGTASTVAEARDALIHGRFNVVITDFGLADGSGADVADAAGELQPESRTLVITGANETKAIEAAIRTGCAGFVSKGRGMDELVDTVRAIAGGAAVFPAALLAIATRTSSTRPGADLTAREAEVLTLLARAQTIAEIADHLVLSQHTVRNHVRRVLAKLHARNQLEAVVIALREGLVAIDDGSST